MVYRHSQYFTDTIHFEVDSTESVWYKGWYEKWGIDPILKLTPQSQYGIATAACSFAHASF